MHISMTLARSSRLDLALLERQETATLYATLSRTWACRLLEGTGCALWFQMRFRLRPARCGESRPIRRRLGPMGTSIGPYVRACISGRPQEGRQHTGTRAKRVCRGELLADGRREHKCLLFPLLSLRAQLLTRPLFRREWSRRQRGEHATAGAGFVCKSKGCRFRDPLARRFSRLTPLAKFHFLSASLAHGSLPSKRSKGPRCSVSWRVDTAWLVRNSPACLAQSHSSSTCSWRRPLVYSCCSSPL